MAGAYASFPHWLKLKSLKQARLFAELTRNLSLLAAHSPFLESATLLDEAIVQGFEHDTMVVASLTSSSSFGANADVE